MSANVINANNFLIMTILPSKCTLEQNYIGAKNKVKPAGLTAETRSYFLFALP